MAEINVGGIRIGVSLATADLAKGIEGVQKQMRKMGRQLKSVGTDLTTGLSAPLLAMGAISTKAAIDFQSAFAGVRKTVNATGPEFKVLEQGIRDMAKRLPTTAVDIAKVAENAGQLGIKKENILEFTETLVRLGDSTNITADQASILLAQFANFTNLPQDEFDNLGAAIVDLGNNSATLESDIVNMMHGIGAASSQIGLAHGEMVGLAAAVASTGIEAEKGGSAISKVFRDMNSAVLSNSESLKAYSNIAGVDFKQAFEKDAGDAIVAFVAGLGKVKQAGGDMAAALESVGISEIRAVDTWSRLGLNAGLLADSLARGTQAYKDNQALVDESNKRYATWASQIAISRNIINDFGISLGQKLAPVLINFTTFISNLVSGFSSLHPMLQDFVLIVGGAVALAGPVTYLAGAFLTLWGSVSAPALVAVGAVAAFSAAGYTLYNNWEGIIAGLKAMWADFVNFLGRNLTDAANSIRKFANVGRDLLGKEALPMLQWEDKKPNIKATASLKQNKEAFDALKDSIKGYLPESAKVPTSFDKVGESAAKSAKEVYKLIDIQKSLSDQLLSSELTRSVQELGEGFQDQVIKIDKVEEVLKNLRDAYIKLGLSAEKVDSIIAGVDLIPEPKQEDSNNKPKTPFQSVLSGLGLGLDMSSQFGQDLALQIENSAAQGLISAFESGDVGKAVEDLATSMGSTIGSALGGPIGGAIGQIATQIGVDNIKSVLKGGKLDDLGQIGLALPTGGASFLFNSLIGSEDAQTAARSQIESFLEETLNRDVIFDGWKENFADTFQEIAGEGRGAFEVLGQAITGLAGVSEDVGAQIGFILSQNLNGNLNEARLLVKELGLSTEDLASYYEQLGLKGEQSWHQVEVALQGVNQLTGEGLTGVGDLAGAYQQLASSTGAGLRPLSALQNLAVEGIEQGITSVDALRANLVATGQVTEEEATRIFQALSQRGITTLEQLKDASNRTLGGVVADLESLGMKWGDVTDGIQGSIDSVNKLQDKLKDLQEGVDVDIRLNYQEQNRPDNLAVDVLPNAKGNAFSKGIIHQFASGGVFNSPTMFGFGSNLGMLGEAGPEAVMPLSRKNGKLGVNVHGGAMGGMTINIDARGAERGVERNIMSAMSQMEERILSRTMRAVSRGF